MKYRIRFREEGHTWYAYRGLCSYYRSQAPQEISNIKKSKKTLTIEDYMKDRFDKVIQGTKAQYTLDEID
jgi:hypothetical protein